MSICVGTADGNSALIVGAVSICVGLGVGRSVGFDEGCDVGSTVGFDDGSKEGCDVGLTDATRVGFTLEVVGDNDGETLGSGPLMKIVGCSVGGFVGCRVGSAVVLK